MTPRLTYLTVAVAVFTILPLAAGDDPPAALDPAVAKLLDLDQRDEAFRKVIKRQVYRGEGTYTETDAKPVRHVIVCPQVKGPPLFAVFPKSRENQPIHRPDGHLVLVDSDGAIVRVYHAANSLSNGDTIQDINGDGVMDVVQSWGIANDLKGPSCQVLHVIPVTREQRPALRVAYNHSAGAGDWGWRLREKGKVWLIELGPKQPRTDDIEVKAVFRWSEKEQGYEGPGGGADQAFMRLADDGDKSFRRFLDQKK
jgi:hypothetical protein